MAERIVVTAMGAVTPMGLGMETLWQGLLAGANVLMPSFTPPACRSAYRIYDNKAQVSLAAARHAITAAGLRHRLPAVPPAGDPAHV